MDEAFYERITIEELPQAFRLAKILMQKYAPLTVSDLGCATGLYLVPFVAKGIKAYGYDNSNIASNASLLSDGIVRCVDVTSTEFVPDEKCDLAICLEVLEHIPEEKAEAAIRALTIMSDRIIFSAAIPGQGGVGHINCQYKPYWIKLFRKYGFEPNFIATGEIAFEMSKSIHMGWFTQNVMVMERTK
jgi:SAM-dependent methyltransferase